MKPRKYSENLLTAEKFWKHEGQQRNFKMELTFLEVLNKFIYLNKHEE